MPTRDEVKAIIKPTVIRSIVAYARRKVNRRKFQILDLLVPTERKIRSVVGGLETSLGRTLWEPLAKELAANNEFVVNTNGIQMPTIMPSNLNNILQNIIESRLANNGIYDSTSGKRAIIETCQVFIGTPIVSFVDPARGHGVDVWLTKNGTNYLFDTKTVQPNIASLRGYLDQLLHWYAFYYSRFPEGNVESRIVFPYNPYEGDFWINTKNGGRPLEANHDAWVENEFWDFCSGVNGTFGIIKECFVEIHESGDLEQALSEIFRND